MTQPRQNPAFDDLYGHFRFRFVFWFLGTCRYDSDLIVLGQLLITRIELEVIASGLAHR